MRWVQTNAERFFEGANDGIILNGTTGSCCSFTIFPHSLICTLTETLPTLRSVDSQRSQRGGIDLAGHR